MSEADRRKIEFTNADEFMSFVMRFGGNPEKQALFRTASSVGGGYYRDTRPTYVFDVLSGFVNFQGLDTECWYAARPTPPDGWALADDKRIQLSESVKTDVVKILQKLGVSAEALKPFSKTKVTELQELIDASDEVTDEVTLRSTRSKDTIIFPVSGNKDIKEVRVKFTKNGNAVAYQLSADFSQQWEDTLNATKAALGRYGGTIYNLR